MAEPPLQRSPTPPEPPQGLYGSSLEHDPSAQSEPTPLGCWMTSQSGTKWPVRQALQDHTLPLTVRTQIAATQAPIAQSGSMAEYTPEAFMSPIETSASVLATGSLINTYTGEVAQLYEEAMPPPTRQGGDGERERKQMQRRLMAAEGNVNASHRKREQQNPMQAGDAGNISEIASYQVQADVSLETNARGARDLYFNRNELAPTELEMTRNPFGFEGYNNRLRITPWQPVTQELDNKDWAPNATILPGGQRPKHYARLKTDAPPVQHVGLPDGAGGRQAVDGQAPVRRSTAARDAEGQTVTARCVATQQLYGDGVAVATSNVRLREDAQPAKGRSSVGVHEGARVVTAASVLASLDGARGAALPAPQRTDGALRAGGVAAAQATQPRKDESRTATDARMSAGPEGAGAQGLQAQSAPARHDGTAPQQARPQFEVVAGEPRVAAQRLTARQVEQLYGEAAAGVGTTFPQAAAAQALQQAAAPTKLGLSGEGRLILLTSDLAGHRVAAAGQQLRSERIDASRLGVSDGPAVARAAVAATRLLQEQEPAPRAAGAEGHDRHEGGRVVAQRLTAEPAWEPRAAGAGGHDRHEGDRVVARRLIAEPALTTRASGAGRVGLDQHEGGKVAAQRLVEEPALYGRAASTHRDFGGGERTGAVTISAVRGNAVGFRRGYEQVGGDADYGLQSERGVREWRQELLVQPKTMISPEAVGQRAALGRRPERRPRVAKSPYRAGGDRERGGLINPLTEPLASRCEDATEG